MGRPGPGRRRPAPHEGAGAQAALLFGMRPLQNNIRALAEGLSAGPTHGPTLVAPVFYSPRGEPALVASTPAALCSFEQRCKGRLQLQAAKESLAGFLAEHLLE